ncbi:hypothetical protein CHS0354_039305 [Potamilus streckersoni]|uniref:Uncharacterized protein n=1 Tax=Potamilus streckersoni TaxID=2493646 RepID=A0AAE0SYF4_9BIVA|nr:hypothetical protein CHS0354_039305 [Potamilus streckersoni]
MYIRISRTAQVSNLTKNAHSHTDDSHQEETLLQHYWTIVTNVRGEAFTALERDINVDLTEYFDPATDITPGHNHSEELEACSHYSDPIAIETSSSESVKSDGYINPVHSSPAKLNEYINPRWSHPLECNAYIHPVHSGSFEHGGYTDPTPSGYMGKQ